MRIQTILNRVEKFKSFIYGEAAWRRGRTGRHWWFRYGRGRTVGLIVPDVAAQAPRTTVLKNVGSSSCPCGGFWSSWLTGCDG